MKLVKTKLCTFILGLIVATSAFGIHWETDYQKALGQAKAQSKPLLLFFTGTGWCPYCVKLENEVFKTQEFENAAGNQYIFMMIDYQHGKVSQKTKDLLDQYHIKGFPTVVIVNGQEKVLGEVGYKSGGGKKYADTLSQLIK